jgi:hypothetical protein
VWIKKFPDYFTQTANRWNYANVCAMFESWQRRQSVYQVASLFENWELHNMSVCHHPFRHIYRFSMDVKLEQRANIKF